MDIDKFHRCIREAVNSADIALWASSDDKKAYCRGLIGDIDEHDMVANILSDALHDLLSCKAEDKFATYRIGDGVSIMGNGACVPATIIAVEENDITVQKDAVADDGSFTTDLSSETILFSRSHDQVFTHIEGRDLSRLILGKRYVDYSAERITARLKHLQQ